MSGEAVAIVQAWKADVERDAWDLVAWNRVVHSVELSTSQETAHIETARSILASATRLFPTCVRFWITYIQFEQRLKQTEIVQQLFKDVLYVLPDVRLWRLHIAFERGFKHGAPGIIKNIFETALKQIGHDPHAHLIWRDFIDFIDSIPATTADEVRGRGGGNMCRALASNALLRSLR
jgi:hypothetical protein